MDLEATAKSLSKRRGAPAKRIAFLVVVGVCVAAGLLLRSGQYFGQFTQETDAPVTVAAPPPETNEPVETAAPPPPAPESSVVEKTESLPTTPPVAEEAAPAPAEQSVESTEPADDAVEQVEPVDDATEPAEQSEPQGPGSGIILVAKRPVEVLASPSSSAPAMYGFPAGRPFRLIGRQGGFAQIQDLRSGASGWIDEAALAPPPRAPAVAAPSPRAPVVSATPSIAKPSAVGQKPSAAGRKPATASADPKPKATKKNSQPTAAAEPEAEPDPAQAPGGPRLFGRGGLFGGIFGNQN
jgi:hypothetical protein